MFRDFSNLLPYPAGVNPAQPGLTHLNLAQNTTKGKTFDRLPMDRQA
jgi:hypothetical protein